MFGVGATASADQTQIVQLAQIGAVPGEGSDVASCTCGAAKAGMDRKHAAAMHTAFESSLRIS